MCTGLGLTEKSAQEFLSPCPEVPSGYFFFLLLRLSVGWKFPAPSPTSRPWFYWSLWVTASWYHGVPIYSSHPLPFLARNPTFLHMSSSSYGSRPSPPCSWTSLHELRDGGEGLNRWEISYEFLSTWRSSWADAWGLLLLEDNLLDV